MVKNPNWQEAEQLAIKLFANVALAKELNSGLPRKTSASGQNANMIQTHEFESAQ